MAIPKINVPTIASIKLNNDRNEKQTDPIAKCNTLSDGKLSMKFGFLIL